MATRINVIQLTLWTALALWVLPGRGHFLFDEAYTYHQAFLLAHHGVWPVFGPPISGTSPTAFTPGGSLYVLLSVPLLFTADPRWVVAWIIVLSSAGIWLFDRALAGIGTPPAARVFAVAAVTWPVWHANFVDRIWNANVFWGISLAMLAVALTLSKGAADAAGRRRGAGAHAARMAAFGALSALALQAHIGGGLAVAACVFVVLRNPAERWAVSRWIPYAAGFISLFLPYVWHEVTHGLANTMAMRSAELHRGWNLDAVRAAALLPLSVASTFPNTRRFSEALWGIGHLQNMGTALAVGCCTVLVIAATLLFLSRPGRFRAMVVFCWIVIPLYFILNQRDYFDHYVIGVAPYLLLPLGFGLAGLFARGRAGAAIAIGAVTLWAGLHTMIWVRDYVGEPHMPTLATQLKRARVIGADGSPMPVRENDPDAFVMWTLASDVWDHELTFWVGERTARCTLVTATPAPGAEILPLGTNAYFRCPR